MNNSQTIAQLKDIKTEMNNLVKNKIIFNARLTDGTNNFLDKADYSGGNAIDFYWQNDKGTPAYITKYRFIYPEANEPTESQLYHSSSWSCNIGAMNSAEDGYEAPFVTINDNKDYICAGNPNASKIQWVSNISFVFENDFRHAPIEIGISRKFGHYINANINTTDYDADPIGIIDGFYYSS